MSTALANFKTSQTHHCVTGSLVDVYHFYDHPISEEMLFGLGEGTGFIYWHQKGQQPFLGGRANPEPSWEELTGQRTGVQIIPHTTASARKAEATLLKLLECGTPVMLQVDMGFLPYFDFGGEEYHFGGHVIVACGYDAASNLVRIADRDAELQTVSLEALAQARGSKYKPYPPRNRWYTFDFSGKRQPTADEICTAIRNQATLMLHPPIRNMGVAGIRKAAHFVPQWGQVLAESDLRMALFNGYIFISPVGGTGGGTFRYMFSRFLEESAEHTGINALSQSAQDFRAIGDHWEQVGEWFRQVSEAPAPGDCLHEVSAPLQEIATLEQAAWERLIEIIS